MHRGERRRTGGAQERVCFKSGWKKGNITSSVVWIQKHSYWNVRTKRAKPEEINCIQGSVSFRDGHFCMQLVLIIVFPCFGFFLHHKIH